MMPRKIHVYSEKMLEFSLWQSLPVMVIVKTQIIEVSPAWKKEMYFSELHQSLLQCSIFMKRQKRHMIAIFFSEETGVSNDEIQKLKRTTNQ